MSARADLCVLMRRLSEDYYCAGWLVGLEDHLWAMVQGGDRHFGVGEVTVEEVARLRELSERAGGWWAWRVGEGARFVPMAEWLARVRQ